MGMRKKIRNKKDSKIKFRSNEYYNFLYNQALKNKNLTTSAFDDNFITTYTEKLKKEKINKEEQINFDKSLIAFLLNF